MRTITKGNLIWVWAIGLMLGAAAAGSAADLPDEKIRATGATHDVNACEAQALQVAQATAPGAKPDERALKIVSIDSARGGVTAQSLATGKMIQFTVAPQTLKSHNLRAGQTIGFAFIVANRIRG